MSSCNVRRMSTFPKYEALQDYLDSNGFTCFPRELRLVGEKHPLVDLAAYKNDAFWAFEYKSFADRLDRGIEQCKGYSHWFNYVSIVIERRLTTRSKYYVICEDLGFGVLLRAIDGSWAWKLDPKSQSPSKERLNYVRRKFASERIFLHYAGTLQFDISPRLEEDYSKLQQKQLMMVPQIANKLKPDSLNLYISVWHTGSLVEPRKVGLVVFSKTRLSEAGYIRTEELKQWIQRPEIVWVLHFPGDDKEWAAVEGEINGRIRTVAEVLTERILLAYNIARDLRYCEMWPKLYSKRSEITEALKEIRGRYE